VTDHGTPRFSIVICTYNRSEELAGAIRSVLDQGPDDFEVVVVDDGSTDDTRSIVEGIDDRRVRYVHRANGGLSAARNTGVVVASGDYVIFLDDDDRFLPDLLSDVAPLTDQGVVVVTWGAEYVDEQGSVIETLLPGPLGPAFEDYTALFRAGTFAVTREAYTAVGGFAEELRTSHQTEFALRLLPMCRRRGFVVEKIDVPLIRIVRRRAGARERNEPRRLLTATLYILDHHHDRLARAPDVLADYLATAGVAAARAGELRQARELFGRAARASRVRSRRWKHRARLLVAAVPPVAGAVWELPG
jgi:glycosyltransferase involved in cell wall biosynthesis